MTPAATGTPVPVSNPHIALDVEGRAYVIGTRFRVSMLVCEKMAYGWSPEEILYQHRDYLTLAQIHSAFAYYYDHKNSVEAEIAREKAWADDYFVTHPNSGPNKAELLARLKAIQGK